MECQYPILKDGVIINRIVRIDKIHGIAEVLTENQFLSREF
jgi:hypothetical protein